jgi:pseudaminic acid cytidylyltransferase
VPIPSDRAPVVAIVPARGGSKRIPRKNIRPFRGIPLLERVVLTLRSSGLFDRIVVSTDDDEIASIGTAAGAEAPFRRPPELSDDRTGARPVIIHAIEAIEAELGRALGPTCIVYPTAVFVTIEDLASSLETLGTTESEFVFSAVEFDAPVQRALVRLADGSCAPMWSQHIGTRTQDLEPTYHDAGQFYWGQRDAWLAGRPVFESRSQMCILPRWRVQDIDTPDDWARAELIHRLLHGDDPG